MASPAVLPALAVGAGVAAGLFGPLPGPLLVILLAAAWISAAVAFAGRRDRGVVLAVTVGYFAAGCLLGDRARDNALHTPLGALFDERIAGRREPQIVALVEGRLRRDGAPGPAGVSLSLSVDCVEIEGVGYDTAGGVLVTVRGTLGGLRATEWRAGRRVRVPATLRRPARYLNPGVRDDERMLAWRGTTLVGSVKSAALVDVVAPGGRLDEGAAAARLLVRRAIDAHVGRWSPRSAAVVTAILIGDRAGLDAEMERRLQEAGTYHVIAISGANIAILAGLLLGLLGLVRLPERWAGLLTMAALVAYAWLVGGGSSVNRATVMALTYLGARLWDHRTPPVNAVALAAVLILGAAPLAVADPGFALTFGATVGILLGTGPIAARAGTRRWIREPLLLAAASASAEAVLLPVGAFVFSRVTCAGLALNFAAIPLMTLVQVAGLAAVGLSVFGSTAAGAAGWAAHLGVVGLVDSARLVDLAPWLAQRVPPPAPLVIVVYYAGLTAWFVTATRTGSGTAGHAARRLVRRTAGLTTLAAGVLIVAAPAVGGWGRRAPALQVTFLDAGQGDAACVRFPDGRSLLVDASGGVGDTFDPGARVVVPALWALGLRRLDYLAITHGHPDHAGGAPAILRDLRPSEVWEGTPVPPHEPLRLLRREAGLVRAAWRTLQAGDRVSIGGAELTVWHPPPPDWERQRIRDDDSLVIEIVFGRVSVLLTGDVGFEVERQLAPQLTPSPLRILKVAHHGSLTSSAIEWVRALRPVAAVVSAGRGNPYGHPAAAVLQRYRDIGAAVFRTDQDGAVTVDTDGATVSIRTFTGRTLVAASRP